MVRFVNALASSSSNFFSTVAMAAPPNNNNNNKLLPIKSYRITSPLLVRLRDMLVAPD